MGHIEVGEENSVPIQLYFHDHGDGQPVVLIHGWPLSERSWEMQESVLIEQGYRVITYDRRGFGQSDKPAYGYDYDTLAEDLNLLMTRLNLQNAILVGFSMGAGEVARYLGTFGSARVEKAVFISGITPALLKSEENPEGVQQKIFDDMMKKILEDRPAFLSHFTKDFFSTGRLSIKTVSEETMRFCWLQGAMASPMATFSCVSSWLEDFRADILSIDVPVLIIHGDSDQTLPIQSTARRLREMIPGARYVEIKGGPHGVIISHATEVNSALLNFFAEASRKREIQADLQH